MNRAVLGIAGAVVAATVGWSTTTTDGAAAEAPGEGVAGPAAEPLGEPPASSDRLPAPAPSDPVPLPVPLTPSELAPVPMPRVHPAEPGPVPMPLVRPSEPGPVPMPEVNPAGPVLPPSWAAPPR